MPHLQVLTFWCWLFPQPRSRHWREVVLHPVRLTPVLELSLPNMWSWLSCIIFWGVSEFELHALFSDYWIYIDLCFSQCIFCLKIFKCKMLLLIEKSSNWLCRADTCFGSPQPMSEFWDSASHSSSWEQWWWLNYLCFVTQISTWIVFSAPDLGLTQTFWE